MSKLKNTPWKAVMIGPNNWVVKDCESWSFAATLDEPTARAIAALPETLAELEAVKLDAENLAEQLSECQSDNSILIDKLSQAEKERDELIEAAKKVEAAWLNWDEDGSRQMTAAIDEMEQLLTPKEYTENEQNCKGCIGPCGECETPKE